MMLKGNPGQTKNQLFSTMGRTKLYVKVNQYYGTKKGGGSMEKYSYYLVVYWESRGGGMPLMVMLDMLTYFRHN